MEGVVPQGDGGSVYDVVVIGSGLGGLTCGALLAREGLRVVVLEQGEGIGGLAHAFERDGRVFDSAIRVMAEGEMVEGLLEHLGVAGECTLRQLDTLYRADFPGMTVDARAGLDAFVEEHVRHFPAEEAGIREFFGLRRKMFLEMASAPMRITDPAVLSQAVELMPTLMTYRNATLAEVMDAHLHDPRLKAACAALWPYMGAPPDKLSFFAYSQFIGVLVDGPYYCMGSFQKLADALALAITRRGGAVRTRTAATKILLDDAGTVTGVLTGTGEEFRAGVVVSAADARATFDELIGVEHLPSRFVTRLHRMTPSASACVVYAAVEADAVDGLHDHEVFLYRHWEHERTWADVQAARPAGMSLTVTSMIDPTLAPPGEHLVIGTSVAPYRRPDGQPWGPHKEEYADALLAQFETVIPGMRDKLTYLQVGTPETIARFTRNHEGATYGWELSPRQIGGKRLAHSGIVPGLFLCGHWTEEGPASFRVVLSGMNTAREVLGHLGSDAVVPTFKPADVPALAL